MDTQTFIDQISQFGASLTISERQLRVNIEKVREVYVQFRAQATAKTHLGKRVPYWRPGAEMPAWIAPDYYKGVFYDFAKNTCDRCHITKEEAKKFPVNTGINHPEYRFSTSFSLDTKGGVLCARCHKEQALESLFALMDAKEERQKQNA